MITIAGCAQPPVQPRDPVSPDDFPAIGTLPVINASDPSLVVMGKRLFFDPRISGDGAISCATCHDPLQGFTRQKDNSDNPISLSDAYPGTRYFRNAPTLINTAYKEKFKDVGWGWDGRMGANLEDVMRDQIVESVIMNMDMRLMQERMKQDSLYVKMCSETLGGECSSGMALKALASFVYTLTSRDAPFDLNKLSPIAAEGRALFEGKAECIRCHNGTYFSDGNPHNTGVPENLEIFTNPLRHIAFRAVMTSHGVPKSDIWRRDVGYFLVSKNYKDIGSFITPTLRELKYTAPYMHNGVYKTLEEVVAFYNRGGGHDDPLARELQPLNLNDKEQKSLVIFLEALSSVTPWIMEQTDSPEEYESIPNWLEVSN